jgi:hypothetical protein
MLKKNNYDLLHFEVWLLDKHYPRTIRLFVFAFHFLYYCSIHKFRFLAKKNTSSLPGFSVIYITITR